MNDQLKAKLKQYGTLSASLLVVGTKVARSQVLYTDLDPDVVVGANGFLALDLDQDSSNDMNLEQTNYKYYYYYYNSVSAPCPTIK